MVNLPHIEYHVGSKCNFRCANCSQLTPIRKPWFASLDVFERDVMNFARVAHAEHFEFEGGEPTLYPHLWEAVEIVRRSGIAPELHMFTNGSTLNKQPEEFWKTFKRVLLSNYPGKNSPKQVAEWRAHSEKYGNRFDVNDVKAFRAVLYRERRDQEHAQKVYSNCGYRWDKCIANGYFYDCAMMFYVPEYGGDVLPQGTDGILLEGLTEEALRVYLAGNHSIEACRRCSMHDYTCVMYDGAPRAVPWHETSPEKWLEESSC